MTCQRVAIVDSEPLFRQGIIDAIDPKLVRIVGEGYGRDSLPKLIARVRPDVLIVDEIGDQLLIDFLGATRARYSFRTIVIAGPFVDGIQLGLLRGMGVSAILDRSATAYEVQLAFRKALDGQPHVSASLVQYRAVEAWLEVGGLDGVDLAILQKVKCGAAKNSIASALGIDEGIVKYRRTRLYKRLGVHNRIEAIRKLTQSAPDMHLVGDAGTSEHLAIPSDDAAHSVSVDEVVADDMATKWRQNGGRRPKGSSWKVGREHIDF